MLQTFLRQIAEHPEDLAARHAFADWLTEQPDPAAQQRGGFIRVQLELARGGLRGARRQELERRERELLARHKQEWAQPLRRSGIPLRCVFRRGMVEAIGCDAGQFLQVAEVKQLLALAPITELILSDVGSSAGSLAAAPLMRRVAALTVRPSLTPPGLATLLSAPANWSGLRKLTLDGNPLGEPGLAVLAGWRGLRILTHLSLRRCDATADGVRSLLGSEYLDTGRGPVSLRRLDLRSNWRFFGRGEQGVLSALAGPFSPGRLAFARRLLFGTRPPCLGEEFASLGPGDELRLLEDLQHPDRHVRARAAERVGGGGLGPECLPVLVRRYFEPRMAGMLRPAIRALRFRVSGVTAGCLDLLVQSDDPVSAVQSVLHQEPSSLPTGVAAAFAALCRRRLAWRARHRGAAPAAEVPGEVSDRPLEALVAAVTGVAEEAAFRGRAPVEVLATASAAPPPSANRTALGLRYSYSVLQPSARVREQARKKESAWLARWLVRLLLQHESGEAKADDAATNAEG
jgi:uncharacterized protein (TIGR02996 family)